MFETHLQAINGIWWWRESKKRGKKCIKHIREKIVITAGQSTYSLNPLNFNTYIVYHDNTQTAISSNALNGKQELFISLQTHPLGMRGWFGRLRVGVVLLNAVGRSAEPHRLTGHAHTCSTSCLLGIIIFWCSARVSSPCWSRGEKWTSSCLKSAPDKEIMFYTVPRWDFFIMQNNRADITTERGKEGLIM